MSPLNPNFPASGWKVITETTLDTRGSEYHNIPPEKPAKEKTMANRKKGKKRRRRFRRATRRVGRRALRRGTIDEAEHGELLLALADDDQCDEMMNVCLAQAVRCGLAEPGTSSAGADWGEFFQSIDWEKLAEFIRTTIIPLFMV